eukprot:GHVU01073112.1.p1 GENE.GHVU01073112.1~~GHVU01073112.1.p1  ORF type:complete len:194 (+),score=19.00 GHVU01073112.1:249-830(+)
MLCEVPVPLSDCSIVRQGGVSTDSSLIYLSLHTSFFQLCSHWCVAICTDDPSLSDSESDEIGSQAVPAPSGYSTQAQSLPFPNKQSREEVPSGSKSMGYSTAANTAQTLVNDTNQRAKTVEALSTVSASDARVDGDVKNSSAEKFDIVSVQTQDAASDEKIKESHEPQAERVTPKPQGEPVKRAAAIHPPYLV